MRTSLHCIALVSDGKCDWRSVDSHATCRLLQDSNGCNHGGAAGVERAALGQLPRHAVPGPGRHQLAGTLDDLATGEGLLVSGVNLCNGLGLNG